MSDIARQLGVSQATVSNAFNRPDQLSKELRGRILAAARELGYTGPDPLATTLRRRRTGSVGLIVHEPLTYLFEDAAARMTTTGVAESCGEHGIALVLVPRAEPGAADIVSSALVDGFVAFCDPLERERRAVIRARGLPVVGIDAPIEPRGVYVGIDDVASATLAAQHVTTLGHRRVGVITFPVGTDGVTGVVAEGLDIATQYVATRDRLAGYAAVVRPAGVAVHVAVAAGVEERHGSRAAQALLMLPQRPTALLAMSDRLAIGAMAQARARGLSVPTDLSVVGFDDIPDAAPAGLTTVRQPHRAKGALALALVLDSERAEGPVLLPTELVVRSSTAPAAPA